MIATKGRRIERITNLILCAISLFRNQVDNDVIAEDIQNPLYDPHAHPLILQLTGGSASTSTPNQQSSAHYPSSSDFATSPIWNPDESGNLHIHTCLTRAPPATHNFHDLSISRLNFRRSETAERLKRFVDSPDIWEYLSPMSGGDSNVDGQYQSSQTQQQYSQSSPSPPTTSPPLQSPHPSQPPISLTPDSGTQESVFKTIVKRLKVLEANYTRSFKFMQEQSRVFLDILHKIDQEHSDGLELLYDEVDKTLTQLYMELVRKKDSH